MKENLLSETEKSIMECFWREGAMRSEELARLMADRQWKPSTLLTFLSRLAAKGMLGVEKQGKTNLYRPLVGRDAYLQSAGRSFLRDVYGGKATDFVAAMVDGGSISNDELAALKAWLADKEGE